MSVSESETDGWYAVKRGWTPEAGGTPGNRVWMEVAEQKQRCKKRNTDHQTKTRAGFVCVQGIRTGSSGRSRGLGGLHLYDRSLVLGLLQLCTQLLRALFSGSEPCF